MTRNEVRQTEFSVANLRSDLPTTLRRRSNRKVPNLGSSTVFAHAYNKDENDSIIKKLLFIDSISVKAKSVKNNAIIVKSLKANTTYN